MKILLLLGLLLLQSPGYEPGDETPEPDRPAQCDNYHSTPPDHRCECARARQNCKGKLPEPPADVRMDARCKTYCRQQHCQCAGEGCTS